MPCPRPLIPAAETSDPSNCTENKTALGMAQIYCSRFIARGMLSLFGAYPDFLSRCAATIVHLKIAAPHQSFVPPLAILDRNSGRPFASSLTRNREPAAAPSSCFLFPPAVVT